MLRTTWRGPARWPVPCVVAPAMMLMTSWPSVRWPPQFATDADEHLRLDRQDDHVRVGDGSDVVLDRADAIAADSSSRRSARGWLATI